MADIALVHERRIRFKTIIIVALTLSAILPMFHRVEATGSLFSYSRGWGAFGGPSGPNMVALDSAGNLYVTDSQNLVVGKIAKNGTLIGLWGGPGQFINPFGITVDNARSMVFVTDSGTNTVYKYTTAGILQTSWNSNGTTNGLLNRPLGVAVNSTGYVYVVDRGNQRVGIFNTGGGFVKYFKLGSAGNFTLPVGIAIDPQGFVYIDDENTEIRDRFSGNITKFTKNGNFVTSWGGANLGGTLFAPQGLTVDNATNIYVADNLMNRVQKFNTGNQNLLLTWGTTGTGPGQFSEPIGVAVDSQASVFVSDPFNFQVQKFSGTTGLLGSPSSYSYQRKGSFYNPYGVALDKFGNIYVADQANDRVQKFNSTTGGLATSWGTYGSLPGQFSGPSNVALDHTGKVYVTDPGNNRVQKFFPNGTFIASWTLATGENGLGYPSGIGVDNLDRIYVTDLVNNKVEKFDTSGNLLLQWGSTGSTNGLFNSPAAITVDSGNLIYVADSGNNRIQKFTSTGSFLSTLGNLGSGNGQFNYPEGVAIDSAGNIYVTDTYNSRVQVFAGNLTFITAFGTPGTLNGQMTNPAGIVIDGSDAIYVTDSNLQIPGTANNRVEVFNPIHDPAATKLLTSRNNAYQGVPLVQPIKVNLTVTNYGLSNETITVQAWANTTAIGQQSVTLTPGQIMLVPFTWTPSVLRRTAYNITGQVLGTPGDPNLANNKIQGGLFFVRLKGDVNGDCNVDIVDLASVGVEFGLTSSASNYTPSRDLNNDGSIDIVDLVLVAGSFGQPCT